MNHYEWLDENFPIFLKRLGVDFEKRCSGIITAHGDKVYGYEDMFKKLGIHFFHGCALYLLTYMSPWSTECKTQGLFDFENWLSKNKSKFINLLPPAEGILGKCLICKKDIKTSNRIMKVTEIRYPLPEIIIYDKEVGYICNSHHGAYDYMISIIRERINNG